MKSLFNKLKQSEIFYGILVSVMVFPMGLLIIACADTAISWRWTKVNTTLEAVNLSVNVVDYLQTKRIADNPDRWYEKNHFLGEHPSTGQVNIIFPLLYLTKLTLSVVTPNPYRYYLQGLWIGISGETIRENYNKGIKP